MQQQPSKNFVGKKIDDYILVDVLGTGAFGQVFAAQNISSKETVAIKSVPKVKLREHNGMVGQLLKTEVQVLMQCNNPNVVKMNKYLESENNCYLVMEYCNQGDLEQLWKKKNRIISENEAIQYLKQILNGMRGLHEMNVIHRDLKLPNILISNNILKIGDLGFAKRLESEHSLVKEALGTLGTMAPEIIEFKPYGLLADMFSLGAIFYQLLFGQLPFSIKTYDDFLKDVKQNPPNFTKNNVQISKESQELITKMLKPDPKQRLQWSQLYESPLFQDNPIHMTGTLNQVLTVQQVMAKQVDLKQNKQVYKEKQIQLDAITDKNMFENLQPAQISQKQINDQQPENEQLLQEAVRQQQQIKQKNEELNIVFEKYLSERNTFVFLATFLQEIHSYTHTQNTNVFLPAFMVAKKLIIEMNKFLETLKKQQNIFQCKYFVELYTFPQFIAFGKLCKEDYDVTFTHFQVIHQQLQAIFAKMPQANQQYVMELQPAPSSNFDSNYKDILLNYYLQLQEEKTYHKNTETINNLSIYTLDAILFDKSTKKMLLTKKVDDYFNEFNFLTDQEKEKILENKFCEAFM